jgi:hypothetical protein
MAPPCKYCKHAEKGSDNYGIKKFSGYICLGMPIPLIDYHEATGLCEQFQLLTAEQLQKHEEKAAILVAIMMDDYS